MYKAIKHFADLKDNNHVYNPGDVFPRKGLDVSVERLAELSGYKNKQGMPLIELVKAEPPKTAAKKKAAKKA